MIHFDTINWAQVVLIQTGLILQAVAIHSLLKGSSSAQSKTHEAEETAEHLDAEHLDEMEQGHEDDAHVEIPHEEAPRMMPSTSNLTRTSKVKFKQSFKFREQPTHAHHRIEH